MRTTLNLDDEVLEKAASLTGITEKTQLLHEGLKALISLESSKRLAKLGASSPENRGYSPPMILVDTSVWIDFLRQGNQSLTRVLEQGQVATHDLVIGELSCGNISKRDGFLSLLSDLPRVAAVSHDEALAFIEAHKTFGKGVGYTDHLILCAAIIADCPLWTLDKRLVSLAKQYAKVPDFTL